MQSQDLYFERLPFTYTIAGVTCSYFIEQRDNSFAIEQNGSVIAELQHQEKWVQVAGEPLSDELLQAVCDKIEGYFD